MCLLTRRGTYSLRVRATSMPTTVSITRSLAIGDISLLSRLGGFYVQFITEMGNLPLMTASSSFVTVTEYVQGTQLNVECGGVNMGVCDHSAGVCMCADYQASSNSSNAPGMKFITL